MMRSTESTRTSLAELQQLFDILKDEAGQVYFKYIVQKLGETGIQEDDTRIQNLKDTACDQLGLSLKAFLECPIEANDLMRLFSSNWRFFYRAITQTLIIPNYEKFVSEVKELFQKQTNNKIGTPSNYVPELQKIPPDQWGVSICTIDGQRICLGDCKAPFTIQEISYPFLYAKCLEVFGFSTVSEYVRLESKPDETSIKDLKTNDMPYNPLINSGCLTLSSLFCDQQKRSGTAADRHYEFFQFLKEMSCNLCLQISTQIYVSEQSNDDFSRSIANSLADQGIIPTYTNLQTILDFYFEIRSLELDCDGLSLMAATLANLGKHPVTGQQLIESENVKYVLSAMHNWGNDSFSGNNAFYLGLPSKHCTSGGFILVVPGFLGVASYSPRIDTNDVSPRNIIFAQEFVKYFDLHPNTNLLKQTKKKFPTRKAPKVCCENYCGLFRAAAKNNLKQIMCIYQQDADTLFQTDLEGRTILHVAAANGHKELVKYLTVNFPRMCIMMDSFGRKPKDYVRSLDKNYAELSILLKKAEEAAALCEKMQ